MRLTLDVYPLHTLEDRCAILEAFAEAAVESMVAEMEGKADAYPCCIKCGKIGLTPVPGMIGQPGPRGEGPAISEAQSAALLRAHKISDLEAWRNSHAGPLALRVRSARELSRARTGHPLELAIFVAALDRLEGKASRVVLDYAPLGNCHAYVERPDGSTHNPQDDTVSSSPCNCEGHDAAGQGGA
jgi:hypothetical protein